MLRVPRKDYQAFPAKVCGMLAQLRAQRQTAENEERNMVDYRKSLDKWFQTNGDPGDAPDADASEDTRNLHAERLHVFESKCTSYTRALKAIDAARSVHKWLASKIDSVIDLGMDPKLADRFVNDALDQLTRDAPELPLFKMAAEDAAAVKSGSEHVDKHDGTIEPIDGPKIGGQYYVSDPGDSSEPTAWAIVRVDGRKSGSQYYTTLLKASKTWKGEPLIDFDEMDWRADDTTVSYLDRPVEYLTTVEQHGSQVVSDAAVKCLKNAEIEIVRQIGKLEAIYGLSDSDREEIARAIEILQKREKAEEAAAAA